MTLPRQLFQIDYDQFHRYAAVMVLLKPLLLKWQEAGKLLRVLEVGSHTLNLLPAFLSPVRVEVVRADLEPAYAGDVGPYITLQRDRPLPFEDGAFDVTVAMEVLEHIPNEQRVSAVGEWARVASRGVVFTCPNGDEVADHERRADADFQARHGRAHPWLMEHALFGRPTQEQIQELCRALGLSCHRFYNSSLAEWLPLLLATEQIFEHGDRELLARFNEMLNTRPFHPFTQAPGYRCIYAAMKSVEVVEQARECWQTLNREASNDSTVVDPVRVLARRLSQFVIEQRRLEVDGNRLVAAEAELEVLRRQLKAARQRLICEQWRSSEKRWWRWRASPQARIKLTGALLQDVQRLEDGCWHVTGNQPRLEWACDYRRGWNRIEIVGRGAVGEEVSLYPDYGEGFREDHVVGVGSWKTGFTTLSVNAYFHHPVRRIRMVPCQSQCPLLVDSLKIRSVSSLSVAMQGLARLTTEIFMHPRWTWPAIRQAKSLLRLGMQVTMLPKGLPIGAETEYHHRLMRQTPSLLWRARLAKRHVKSRCKLAIFLRILKSDTTESIVTTLRSLARVDAGGWEFWCAVEDRTMIESLGLEQIPVHWLQDQPDRGLAGLLNECAEVSQATWLMMLHAGDMVEPDMSIQVLHSASVHPQAALIYADEDQQLPVEGPSRPMLKAELTPQTLREQPERLGQAVAVHVPTLLKSGGFHPGYEGALLTEYLYRLLDQGENLAHCNRVLLHQPPRPAPGIQVQKLLERLREEYSVDDYNIRYARVLVKTNQTLMPELHRPAAREDASC